MAKVFDRNAIAQYVKDFITADYIEDYDVNGIVDELWGIDLDGECIDTQNIEEIDLYEIIERHDVSGK